METVDHPEDRRAARYVRAAARYRRRLERTERRISVIAGVRLASFTVAVLATFVAFYDRLPAVYLPFAAAAAVVFGVAVWLHRRPFAMAPRLAALAEINERGAARLAGDWDALDEDGARYLDPREPRLSELQLFGRGSVFQLLDRTTLPAGRDRLAAVLRDGVEVDALPERQAAARELAGLRGFRHRLEAEGRLVKVDDAALDRFLQWAETHEEPGWLKPTAWLGALLVPATWIQIVLSAGFDMNTAWRLTFIAQVIVYAATTRHLSAQYVGLIGDERHRPFVALRRMFALVERRTLRSPLLQRMKAALGAGPDRPSARMAQLEKVLESLAVRHSALLYSAVSIGFLWELFQGARLERWRARYGDRVRGDLAALSDFEALASIGAFADDHAGYAWPTVRPGEPVLRGQALGHPLFDRHRRVHNDFEITTGGTLELITGSNMSGKSSFLRTVGINATLAQAGAPVCGDGLELVPCRLSTSIQVTDAPGEGLSRFYAEVKRIARILNEVERAERDPTLKPRLYLVDEMLSGTNSRERHLACRTIVRRLAGAERSFGLVTTHDLELVQVTESVDAGHIPTHHFSDRFDGEALHFDYKLKSGVARTTNALHVLQMEGIEIET